ncbi:acyltransferase [Shigella flexneri]
MNSEIKVMSNREPSIDTLRVTACIFVIISHYGYIFSQTRLSFIPSFYGGVLGQVGVSLFFFISGYLAFISLDRKNTIDYFLDKGVRILTPYIITYFFISLLLILLSYLNKEIINTVPLVSIMTTGGQYTRIIPVFFALDGILNAHFSYDFLFLTGEWFIGCVIMLYVISPIVFHVMNTFTFKRNIFFLFVITITTFPISNISSSFLNFPFWFFACRLPEFMVGMLAFKYKNKLQKNTTVILSVVICILTVLLIGPNEFKTNIVNHQLSIIPLMCISIIIYKAALIINKKFNLYFFNSYAKCIYISMLIQHVVIYRLTSIIEINNASVFGYLFILLMVFFLTFYLSKKILIPTSKIESILIKKMNIINAKKAN